MKLSRAALTLLALLIGFTSPALVQGKAGCGFACTDVYDPVCGTNGVTYSNACQASCAKVAVAYKGTCDGGGGSVRKLSQLATARRALKQGCPSGCHAPPKPKRSLHQQVQTPARRVLRGVVQRSLQQLVDNPTPRCLRVGARCVRLSPQPCCPGLTCYTGPIIRERQLVGTCRGRPFPIG